MIRTILVGLFLVIFFIVGLPVLLVEYIIGKFNRNARDKSSKVIVKFAFKVILFISGAKIDVTGKENIPMDEPLLIIGNHSGFFDILVLYTVIPHVFGFVAKKEIAKVPFLRLWMKLINCIFIDRTNIKEGLKSILKAIDKVKKGVSICIFPEGTRSHDGNLLPFKEGSFKIADKSGCAVLPVAIKGTADIFENHLPKIKKARVTVKIAPPFYPDSLDKEDRKHMGAYTQKIIQNMLDEM